MNKAEIMRDIFKTIKQNTAVESARIFNNIEGDLVVTYEQDGNRYLVSIDEIEK